MSHVLDRCIWHALTGVQARFAEGGALARRYRPEFGPFAATRDDSAASLTALAALLPPGSGAALFTPEPVEVPPPLAVAHREPITQMVLDRLAVAPLLPPGTRALGADDVPAMLALVALTEPGPFGARTAELGRFVGVFADGALIAMAGERMRAGAYTEVSAVCTHPAHRQRGLASAMIASLAADVLGRGETPFLHVRGGNAAAVAVYRRLGFVDRATMHLAVVRQAN